MLWPASLESCNVLWSQLSNTHLTLYYFPAVLITQCNQGNLRNRVNFGIWFQAENHHDSKRQVWQQDQGTERLHLQPQPCEHEAESVNWRCSEALNSQNPIEVMCFPPTRLHHLALECCQLVPEFKYWRLWKAFLIQTITMFFVCLCLWKNGQFQMCKYSLLSLNATVSHIVDSHRTDFCN